MQENQNVSNSTVKQKKSKKRIIIVLVFLILFALCTFVSLRGSYLEIAEIGEEYISVFKKNVSYKYITMGANFVFLFAILYITNRSIRKGLKSFFEEEKKEMPKLPNKSISLIIGAILSFLTADLFSQSIMLCFNNAWFGIEDPVFGMDVGYFIFQKPFIEMMILYIIILVVGLTVYTAIYYIICFNVYFDGINRQTLKNSKFIKQIIRNIRILTLLFAAFVLVKTQDVVFQKFIKLNTDTTSYELYGAGMIDTTVKLWGYRILALVMVISVYLAIYFFKKGQTKKIICAILAVPMYLIGMFVVMLVFQFGFINSNELDKQKQYILSNIEYTKNAYNINIEEFSLMNSGTITSEEVEDYQQVIGNIAIVNKDATLKALNSLQTSKGYYTYEDTQIGKYVINGKETLVYLSPREVINNDTGRTYNNKTYEYTHGYGMIVSSAVQADENGNIHYLQKAFDNSDEKIEITQPRIYFGLTTNSTVVTNSTNKKEFDYPILNSKTAENAENIYDGNAGLSLTFLDRLMLAIKEKDLNLALSGNVDKNSKILTNRNIIERAKKVMPYLVYDDTPYLVVNSQGKLIWVIDAYTVTNNYPYSQKSIIEQNGVRQEINYIRNSVKVLVDAYDGTVKFYITDRTDPLIMAYRNVYQGLFLDVNEQLPEDIQKQLVYSEFLYQIQANMLTRYHNMQADVLYRSDDVWDIATHKAGKTNTVVTGTKLKPYYTMIKTQEGNNEIGLILPYTPAGKQNLTAYLVGTHEGESTGKLTLYKFSSDSNMIGPMQLDTQIEQDETIAKEIETLNGNGIKVVRDMIMVPVGNTVLYVEPIYQVFLNELQVPPMLKKVVVASGNKVSIGDNVQEALSKLLSQYAVDIEVENTEDIEGLIDAIIKANINLETSSSNNDWEMIGKDMNKLQNLINKLQKLMEEQEKEKKNTVMNTQNTIEEKNSYPNVTR